MSERRKSVLTEQDLQLISSLAHALGITDPWRYEPNVPASTLKAMLRLPAQK